MPPFPTPAQHRFRPGLLRGAVSLGALALLLLAQQGRAQDAAPPDQDEPDTTVPAAPSDTQLPTIEPVISDEEFEATLSELEMPDDPQLEAPLDSIAEFERRLAAEGEGAETEAQVQPVRGSQMVLDNAGEADDTSGAPVPVGMAPISDPELLAPLPPLEDFALEPVDVAQEATTSKAARELTYEVQITGLADAERGSGTNLQALFNELSALRGGKGKAVNIAQITARMNEDRALLERILASEGWYEAQVSSRIERGQVDNRPQLTALIEAAPGARYTFAQINVDAGPVEPPGLISDSLTLRIGDPIIAARVIEAEAKVSVALRENGYPFAELGARDVVLDQTNGQGVYTLPVVTGPRARFGSIRASGAQVFDAEHIGVLARFEPGGIFDESKLDDLRQALVATGLFNTIAITPEQTGEMAPDGTQHATIVVDQTAGPPRSLAASVGFETGQGFRLAGTWTHRNLFPPEGALIARGVAGTQEQGAGLTFRRSNAGKRDKTFLASLEALQADYEAFEALTGRLSALVSYDSTNLWRKPFTYTYGGQLIATNEESVDPQQRTSTRRTFFIAGLTGQVGIDRSDSLLNPSKGYRATVLIEPEGSLEGEFTPYVRAQVDGSAYFSPSDAITLAGRVRLGTIQGIDRFDLAPSRRFYAGGGGSVRGFGFQQIGPRVPVPNPDFDPLDEDETSDPFLFRPVGGRGLNEAAFEVRYRFGDFGIVGFVDAGQVYDESLPDFGDLRFGAGIGGRYYTSFGPMRVDIGIPIDRREGESAFAIYVSIGQAF